MQIDVNYMKYNKSFHRYLLTVEGINVIVDSNVLSNYYNIETLTNSISNTVYNYIYSKVDISKKDYIEYLLAKNELIKTILLDAMLSQLNYIVKNHIKADISTISLCQESVDIINDYDLKCDLYCEKIKSVVMPTNKYERWEY